MAQLTKLSGLTALNVRALSETLRPRIESGDLQLGKTIAVFHMDAAEAYELVSNTITRTPGRGHPKQSLRAVQRKLAAQLHQTPLEQQVEQEEVEHQEQQDAGFVEPEDTSGRAIYEAALFLTELTYPNMFELRGSSNYCKVCGEEIPRSRQEAHHAGHKRDRANYVTEQIRTRRENADMAKDKAPTPKEQGVPEIYLNADGTKFKPGADASLKRDLIAAIDRLDNPKALHTFDEQTAAKILAARNWNDWLVKSRKNRETQAARAAAKTEAKKAKVKDEVAAKRTATGGTTEVQPDPKPARKPRGSRVRKVGS